MDYKDNGHAGHYDSRATYDPYNTGAWQPQEHASAATFADAGNGHIRQRSVFETEKTPTTVRAWRTANQRVPWTQGGRTRSIGRFCCCSLLITAFLLISILLSLALWARPPNISINNVRPPETGSAIQVQDDGLSINLSVNISVSNPNYFSVNFNKIQADIFHPIGNTPLGGGRQNNLVFKAYETTQFDFPFTITYRRSMDPGNRILTDLAKRCGFSGGTKSDIEVQYSITLGLRILFVGISPDIRNAFRFECPIKESDLAGLLSKSGLSISDLLG